MKVLISNPPWYIPIGAVKAKVTSSGLRAGGRWPYTSPGIPLGYFPFPLNMAYADAHLKRMGVDSTMRDSIMLRDEYKDFFAHAAKYDYVVLETAIASRENDWYVITRVATHRITLLCFSTLVMWTMPLSRPEMRHCTGTQRRDIHLLSICGGAGVARSIALSATPRTSRKAIDTEHIVPDVLKQN